MTIYQLHINSTLIDNAEVLDIVMPLCNLNEYSKHYLKTQGRLWIYYRDEPNSGAVGKINYSIKDSKSLAYEASIKGNLEGYYIEVEGVEIIVPLKYSTNFWTILDIPLINCEVSLTLTWFANCTLTNQVARDANSDANPSVAGINNPTDPTFQITDTILYVPVATLSTQGDNKLLDQLKTGFKRTSKWNKYRSEMTKQIKANNLDYLIGPTFNKVNRLFVFSFKNEDDKTSCSKCSNKC